VVAGDHWLKLADDQIAFGARNGEQQWQHQGWERFAARMKRCKPRRVAFLPPTGLQPLERRESLDCSVCGKQSKGLERDRQMRRKLGGVARSNESISHDT